MRCHARTGACLFHAVGMTQDVDAARQLRQAVVRYVVQNWAANPDISEIMGAERRAIQPTILLQEEFCRQCVYLARPTSRVS